MIDSLKEIIEHEAESLWQGRGTDVKVLQDAITKTIGIITAQCEEGFGEGIEFPMQYLLDAIHHYKEAIEKRDDYLLADCLYFEWREIIIVFMELCEELEKNCE